MTEYRYLVLRHQPSLYAKERESFAVLVEGTQGDRRILFAVGRSPEPSLPVSDVAMAISEKFPEILDGLVRTAIREKGPHQDILDTIHENMGWNFQATKPESRQDDEPIYSVAFKLFGEHVAGADELLRSLDVASTRMLRPPDMRQRLGETFQAAVQVPDLDFVPA
ncbi:MAG TPA: hypothetical protein VGT03_12850 [Candidatus Acidoferrales bacterium]|nr:hypothetical protein [Candidatus Acidoferrales bacterium]